MASSSPSDPGSIAQLFTRISQSGDRWKWKIISVVHPVQKYADGKIQVQGSPSFLSRVDRDFRLIQGTVSGKLLLKSIATNRNGHIVNIFESSEPGGNAQPPYDGPNKAFNEHLHRDGSIRDRGSGACIREKCAPGPGTDVVVRYSGWSLSSQEVAEAFGRPACANDPGQAHLSDVTLYHELVHASDYVNGVLDSSSVRTRDETMEAAEARDVGLPEVFVPGRVTVDWSKADFSENRYRRERNYPQRASYLCTPSVRELEKQKIAFPSDIQVAPEVISPKVGDGM